LANYIGVDNDSLPHFDKLVDRIVDKAYSRISFVSRNVHAFRQTYIIYIIPLLELASNVWSSHSISHITSLERAQRHFTKTIIELQDLS